MSDVVIQVKGLGKKYKLGVTHAGWYRNVVKGVTRKLFRRPSPSRVAGQIGREATSGNGSPLSAFRSPSASGEFWALRDIDFEVKHGEVLGVIGVNGAGKSTLLKILSRITTPTTGRAKVIGRVGSLLEVGTGFHPELTGRENVFLNGAILGMRRDYITRHFDAIVDFAEIEEFIDTPVKRYSSGMRVRLAFAVAAHLEPEILLIDEVLAVGDVGFQRKCLGKMGGVASAGRSVLFVSHNMVAVRQLCHRAIWLESGRIRRDGDGDDVVDDYLANAGDANCLGDLKRQIAQLPPDPLFRLNDIEVLQDGVPTTDMVSGKPVEIILDYEVFKSADGLHVYFELRDLDDTLLFESLHNGADEGIPSVSAGRYESRVVIPADFLAPRPYTLRFWAGVHNVRALFPAPLAVPLTVEPSGCVNRAYPGYRTPGRLAPLLPWSTEKVES